MALLNIDGDPWLLEYESCEKLSRDIMEQLTARQRLPRTTEKFTQISAHIRLRLKQYTNEVKQLTQKLNVGTETDILTSAEAERRSRQIELLKSKGYQMEKLFNEQLTQKQMEERTSLMGPSSSFRDEDIEKQSVDEIRRGQKRIIEEQDEGLDNLHKIISRQKDIAHTISNEVDFHHEILDDLGEHMDRTGIRVQKETQHINIVERKDNTCIYWVFIILLFFSIVVVSII